jgi:hypothetical protein
MAKGSSSRSGPPPDPNALRRDRDEGEWKVLPAEGRNGPTPVWPLDKPALRELELWAVEWRRPQAIMWERNHQELEVAIFVRCVADAEKLTSSVAARALVKQQMEALGLSIPGLLRNRWRIADKSEPTAPTKTTERADTRRQPSVKDRLKVVREQAS